MDIKKQIRNFILENFLFTNSDTALSNDQSFMDSGIIDSTGILELITFVEETFEIEIQDDDVIPENLDSVDQLSGFIQRKMGEVLEAA